ncbi:hypothetical protein, partial [Aeromonas hydrophila]|uniref:hypothetical protein n=1 Tax=Aeromonas hydrophila TaxID=644 RepID=UPI003EC8C5BA
MFKKKTLVLVLASVMGATTAYAATLSAPTELVVGFKPEYRNTTGAGSVSGDLKPGSTLTVDPAQLGFDDKDGDAHNIAAVKYSWSLDGTEISTANSVTLPTGNASVGKNITLSVTPVTTTGDPLEGNALVLSNLNLAGAGGGDGNGNISPDVAAKPVVTQLQLAGSLLQGSSLTATYQFDA